MIPFQKKTSLVLGILITLFTLPPLSSQEKFEPSIDISIPIVSIYVFRGTDIFQNSAVINKKSYSSFNLSPAIQHSITFNFSEGWYFNIWSSFALTNRQDKDVDEILQEGSGDTSGTVATAYTSFIAGNLLGTPVPFSTVETAISTRITSNGLDAYLKEQANSPAFYKESIGLRRLDEVDLILGYSKDTKLGTMSGGIVTYLLPNSTKGVIGSDQFTELFVGFSPAAIPNLSITLYGELNGDGFGGSTFTYLKYSIPITESDSFSAEFAPAIAYQILNNLQEIRYVELPFNFSFGSISLSLVGIYRPDTRFYDSDTYRNDSVKLLGLSTYNDGLITDPAANTGLINNIVNSYISSQITTALTNASYHCLYSYTNSEYSQINILFLYWIFNQLLNSRIRLCVFLFKFYSVSSF